MQRQCEFCGKPFEAKRATARFCSGSCRAQASAKRKRAGIPVGEPVSRLDEMGDPDDSPLVRGVRSALSEAGKDGWKALQAVELARKLSTPGESGAASLSKELDRLMGDLLAGVQVETDELDELKGSVIPMRRRRA